VSEVAAPVRFGPYLLVRASAALGRLEMAVRTDVRDPEVCVLKRLPIQARAADAAARFRRQAQVAARLEHENIARTLRVETVEGQICVARELIQGMSLSKVMRQLGARPAPLVATLHIVRQLARGLSYAHDCGGLDIVHGEVAPENVMIGFNGEVKLIDFGLGRPAGEAAPSQGGVVMTHHGWLPPEAADGREPDRPGDLYGLGVVLWELLTGQRADDAAGPPLPDVRASNPEVPEELARVVARATATKPEARYRSGDELGAALTTFLPAGPDPQQETIALLRSCFDVDMLQPLLAKDIANARRLVVGDPDADDEPRLQPTTPLRGSPVRPAPPREPSDDTAALPVRRLRGPLAGAAVAVVVCVGGIAMLRQSPPERPAARAPVAADPPPAPPVAEPAAAPEPSPEVAPQADAEQAAELPAPAGRPSLQGRASRSPRGEGADRLLRQANNLFEHGNTAGAMARTRQAIAAGAGAPAHVLMATLLINLRNYTAAEPELKEATRLDPGNREARRMLALLHRTAAEQNSK
jgi:serine/threonine protein kinase